MSSILEALRELEGERPPGRRPLPPPADAPAPAAARALGLAIPIFGGLAIGVVLFGLFLWSAALRPSAEPSAMPASGTAKEPDTPDRPGWLEKAEPPRARVDRGTAAPAIDHAPARRPAPEPPPAPSPAAEPTRPAPRASSAGRVVVESIAYGPSVPERAATLRLDGRRVTLHQRESAEGIEIQLIMPDGVYVQRGTDVFLVPIER